ncbi:zinc finger protein 761-like [Culex pipiens pallens]|uniref:zinc finger protein 761-like n=1 Tax=Culex pipiens pallens TaxID=42434 RepID=UPI001954F403|nr:zinc finger protein 761-like [Culex pipiens pallens]
MNMMLGEAAAVVLGDLHDQHHQFEETDPLYCYVCNVAISSAADESIGQLCQLFPIITDEEDEALSPAHILSNLLQIDITPELSHSQAICLQCNLLCNEYQHLLDRLDSIKLQLTVSYNSTVAKLTASLTAKDLADAEAEALDDDVSQGLELADPNADIITIPLGDLTAVVPASSEVTDMDSEPTIIRQMPKLHFIPRATEPSSPTRNSNSRSIIKMVPKDAETAPTDVFIKSEICEIPSTITMEQFFEGSDGNMVEIIADEGDPDYIYDNVIETIDGGPGGGDDDEDPGGSDGAEEIGTTTILTLDADGNALELTSCLDRDTQLLAAGGSTHRRLEEDDGDVADVLIAAANESLDRMVKSKLESLFFKTNDNYYCTLCPASDGPPAAHNVKTIGIHLKTDHDEKILICERCDAVFRRRTQYNEHMDKHVASELGSDFRCDVCGTEFANIRTLRMHRKTHVATPKVWSCHVCQKKYSSKNLLDEHSNMHSGKRPFKCPVCPKDFASKYTLSAHMKIHQDRERVFNCKECGRGFYSQNNLIQHEKIHLGVRDYACTDCNKTFMSQHNLDIHKIVHLNYKPFICRTCGKGFARKAEIKDHERTHTGERPFVCDICDASFSQRSNLQSHKRATHFNDKRYKCDLCNRCFKRRRLLDYHIKACHTGERPYKCEVCAATFVYPEHFKKHQKIHTGSKPFACEVCSKTFNSRDNRNAHRFVHSDKKPYECVTCGAGFMRKPQLYSHMQQRGHLNDTIVVNQPRITNDDLLEFDTTTDSIGDPLELDKQGIVYEEDPDELEGARDEYYIEEEEMEEDDGEEEDDDEGGAIPGTSQLVLPGTVELSESTALLAASEGFIDETDIISQDLDDDDDEEGGAGPGGGIQLVKLKIANPNGKDGIAWVNLVSQ